ncbi:Eukaryotic translation initiation factor 2A [Chamberlinius hualienensis]
MANSTLLIAGRGIEGLFMKEGPPSFKDYTKFAKITTGKSKCAVFSKNGDLYAFNDGDSVKVMKLPECELLFTLDSVRTIGLCFSPLGTLLATWEPHGVKKSDDGPAFNLHIFEVKSGKCLKGLHQKRQIGWQPQWTDDEVFVTRIVNNEVHFYANNCFDTIVKKIHLQKVSEYSLSSGKAPYHVACFVPGGASGQPSSVKLFSYPNFETVLASKSFFKADKVEMKWNSTGTACVVLVSVDSDKSGASYYGEQTLHLLTTKGDSCSVQLAKNGPIYSVEWSPVANEFCVVYGFMPAKATLFNLKAETAFDFGTSPRNLVYYNSFGNMLILAGFGNLNGHVEIWDLKQKKEIVRTLARDSTYLAWCPDGEHFMTATLSPRLRVGNGYKIWHYTGKVVHEFACNKDVELWEVFWKPFSQGVFKENKLVYNTSKMTEAEKKPDVYRPPSARGISGIVTKIHEDYEKPSNQKSSNENMSRAALKNKKKRDAKKSKQGKEDIVDEEVETTSSLSTPVLNVNQAAADDKPVDPELEKKIKNLTKKLEQIRLLKQQHAAGKQLEKNQLDKIQKEKELYEELRQLNR